MTKHDPSCAGRARLALGPALGSAFWGRAGGGRLTPVEQVRFALQCVIAQLQMQMRRCGALKGDMARRWSRLDPDRIDLPDSPTVARAHEMMEQSLPHWLCRHSLRTWSWAALLAQRDALRPDREILAVSCLLHDIALLPSSPSPAGLRSPCFAVEGGRRARWFLEASGWDDHRALAVEDAICRHMNPQVGPGAGIEAHLLHEAAALDVVGARITEIDAASKRTVAHRHPRQGFEQQMCEALRQQALRGPGTRTRLLWRMGFERAIRRSPWSA